METIVRAKDMETGEWRTGYYVKLSAGKITSHRIYNGYAERDCDTLYPDFFEIDPNTLGQFSCQHDKYGTPIFEGDIVRQEFENAVGVIRFGIYRSPTNSDEHTNHVGFYPEWTGKAEKLLRKDLGFYTIANGDIEVIGNIFDNPDLIPKEG